MYILISFSKALSVGLFSLVLGADETFVGDFVKMFGL